MHAMQVAGPSLVALATGDPTTESPLNTHIMGLLLQEAWAQLDTGPVTDQPVLIQKDPAIQVHQPAARPALSSLGYLGKQLHAFKTDGMAHTTVWIRKVKP